MSKQINTETSKLVRIDYGVHKMLKIQAAKASQSIKEYLDDTLLDRWNKEEAKWEE